MKLYEIMDLYKLHSNPEQLKGHDTAYSKEPKLLWNEYFELRSDLEGDDNYQFGQYGTPEYTQKRNKALADLEDVKQKIIANRDAWKSNPRYEQYYQKYIENNSDDMDWYTDNTFA